MNPIPCQKCVTVMFCNTKCRSENKVHKIDCGAVYYLDDKLNNKYIIQSILVAVTSEKFAIPKSVLDQHSKYRVFLTLWTPSDIENFVAEVYKLYHTVFCFKEIKKTIQFTIEATISNALGGTSCINLTFQLDPRTNVCFHFIIQSLMCSKYTRNMDGQSHSLYYS